MTSSATPFVLAPDTRVTCPHCEREFGLSDGFARKALESVEAASSDALSQLREAERTAAERRAQQINGERDAAHARALAEVRALAAQSFAPQIEALKAQLGDAQARIAALDQREAAIAARERGIETRISEAAATRAAELVAGERQEYAKRLADQGAQLKALQAEQVGLRQERQRLQDEKAAMALEVQRQVDARLGERDAVIAAREQERAALDKAELQKKLDDVTSQLAEVQRKAEQGSQQLQGEVLELALEEGLRRAFPFDLIEEVKKGVRGGDVIQRVLTRTGEPAAVLLWETKRARDWSPQWHAKLKEDMRGCGAEVGILVTMPTAVPKEWLPGQAFGAVDGVWVVIWPVALQLAEALRAGALDVHKQRLVSAGKGEKMEAVYDYVTSAQFAQKLRAVYDTFGKMRQELESEKAQAMQRWARREKQLDAGMHALLGVGGEIQGLAQQDLPMLEMEVAPDGSEAREA
jgi:hypothetical protein